MFSNGQHVQAQWTNGGYFGARIIQFNGSHYEVAWDDGSPNLWVAAHQIQQDGGGGMPMGGGGGGGGFSVGSHVRAQWTNGQMYGARIVNGNGSSYEVAWDDGSPNLWVAANQIQQDGGGGMPMGGGGGGGGGFSVGSHVRAQWTNGQMYGARIINASGSQYEVAWDDGSPNLWIGAHQIQQEGSGAGISMGGGMPMGGGGGGFSVGSHVRAQWTNGQMYGARIINASGSQYEVAWDDGSPNLWIGAHQIQQEGSGAGISMGGGPTPGAHVQAQWTNGQWYGARVIQTNGSQYEVAWDDGSPNLWIGSQQIRG